MVHRISKWARLSYKKTINSIAFIPAIIASFFLFLSFVLIQFDFSAAGKAIKANAHWLSLKDASTARSIISTITGGMISLTVFSFSMVMILLSQAASQMSNRVLDRLIGNRFQQTILGFYIGTIVYALFLLSTIRDINSGIYVPAISTYFLIALSVVDIFLFIYFLHYVTESVKYETIIHKIQEATKRSLEKYCQLDEFSTENRRISNGKVVNAYKSGIYQGFSQASLLSFCKKEDIIISFFYPSGTLVLQGNPLFAIEFKDTMNQTVEEDLRSLVNIHGGQDIQTNYYYGLRQLMEIAVKALSPGINDPGTAVLSLQALGDLLALRLRNFPVAELKDDEGTVRIIRNERSFEDIFKECIYPIWDYGKEDRLVQNELTHVLLQLQSLSERTSINELLIEVQIKRDLK